MKKPTIVIALTDDYAVKARPLFDSLDRHARDLRICILLIRKNLTPYLPGFRVNNIEYSEIYLLSLTSFRPGWPENRPFYACGEGGEFLEHFHFDDDEVIIHIDADFVMQRGMSDAELAHFSSVADGEVYSNYHSYPPHTLREEFYNLRPKVLIEEALKTYPASWDQRMFCAGFVCCTAWTYRQISAAYLAGIDQMTATFGHHAAGQWLLNYIVSRDHTFINQSPAIHNGWWYKNTPCHVHDRQLWYKDERVLFHHTKFEEL